MRWSFTGNSITHLCFDRCEVITSYYSVDILAYHQLLRPRKWAQCPTISGSQGGCTGLSDELLKYLAQSLGAHHFYGICASEMRPSLTVCSGSTSWLSFPSNVCYVWGKCKQLWEYKKETEVCAGPWVNKSVKRESASRWQLVVWCWFETGFYFSLRLTLTLKTNWD